MKRLHAILTCLLAVLIDAFAALVASGTLPIEPHRNWYLVVTLHLLAVAIVSLAVVRYRHHPDSQATGTRTLAVLANTITLFVPIAGPLTIACLLAGFAKNAASHPPCSDIVIGNPLRTLNSDPSTSPIVTQLNENALARLRTAGSLLHRDQSRQSIAVLRHLQRHPDARTQLQAQGAMTTLSETSEKRIALLRESEASPENSRRLASLLLQVGSSGMRDDASSRTLLDEAIQHLEKSLTASPIDAENTTALQLLAECRLAMGQVEPLPNLIDQLRQQTDGDAFADKIERRYLAAIGRWRELAAGVQDTRLNTTIASRNFWADNPPVT